MTSVESLLLAAAIKGSVLLALAGAGAVVLRRASAATKHLVWTLALAGVLMVPLLGATLPSVSLRISLPGPTAAHGQAAAAGEAAVSAAARTDRWRDSSVRPQKLSVNRQPHVGASEAQIGPVMSPPERMFEGIELRTVLVAVWATGAAVLLMHFAIALWSAIRLVRRSVPVEDDAWQERLEEALGRVGVRRGVILLVSNATTVPLTCGIRRPVIVLPSDAFTWCAERAAVVLLHEAAHIRRHDCFVQCLAQLARALHWFNPLAWIASARVAAERERACDDLVLAAGTRGSSYAEHLLDIARTVRGRHAPAAALAMARPSELEGRLLSILDVARQRRLPTRPALTVVVGVAAIGIASIAALHVEPRVEARANPIPADLSHVVAQGLPAPTPIPTPSAAPTPMPRPAPPARIQQGPTSKAGRQGGNDGEPNSGNPEQSNVDTAARDAIATALVAALKDEDPDVRSSAMASLMRLQSKVAVEPMIAALKDADADVRGQAAFVLGQLRDERAVSPLTAALRDENAEVREKVVFALGQLHAESAVGALSQALKDSNPSVREQAAFALGQIQTEAAVPFLLEALKDAEPDVRGQAAFALGQLHSSAAVPDLIGALKDADADVRKQAAFALGQIGDVRAGDALTAALKDVDAEVRRSAAFALGQMMK